MDFYSTWNRNSKRGERENTFEFLQLCDSIYYFKSIADSRILLNLRERSKRVVVDDDVRVSFSFRATHSCKLKSRCPPWFPISSLYRRVIRVIDQRSLKLREPRIYTPSRGNMREGKYELPCARYRKSYSFTLESNL